MVAEVLGQRRVDLQDVAAALADELGIELGQEDRRSDLDHLVLEGQGVDRLVVPGRREVDLGVVAFLQRPLAHLERREALAEALDLLVHVGVGHLGRRLRHREPGVVLEHGFRTGLDDGLEGQIAAVLERRDVDVRRRDHVDVLGANRLRVQIR